MRDHQKHRTPTLMERSQFHGHSPDPFTACFPDFGLEYNQKCSMIAGAVKKLTIIPSFTMTMWLPMKNCIRGIVVKQSPLRIIAFPLNVDLTALSASIHT